MVWCLSFQIFKCIYWGINTDTDFCLRNMVITIQSLLWLAIFDLMVYFRYLSVSLCLIYNSSGKTSVSPWSILLTFTLNYIPIILWRENLDMLMLLNVFDTWVTELDFLLPKSLSLNKLLWWRWIILSSLWYFWILYSCIGMVSFWVNFLRLD